MAGNRTGRVQTGGVSTGPYDPAMLAEAAANGELLLLSSFALVQPGEGGVVDLDLDLRLAAAWVVGRDDQDEWWSSRVGLEQAPTGAWVATDVTSSTWEGWAAVAANRPALEWPGHGAALAVERLGGEGLVGDGYEAVCGVVSRAVAAVELGWKGRKRRRIVETPTGGFLVSVPVPVVGAPPTPATLRLVDGRGNTVARL